MVLAVLIRAARLDRSAYETIAAERRFWIPALVIVTLGSVSHAALGVVFATQGGWAPIRSIVPAALSQYVIWIVASLVALAIGRAMGSSAPLGGVLRAVGIASIPAVFYAAAIVAPLGYALGAWWIAATYVAIRGSLGLDAGRAAVALVAAGVAGYLAAGFVTLTVLGWL